MRNSKKLRHRLTERNSGTDRYLITYADLITLLLGLFVILYATSRVDSTKFKEMSAAFSEYFKAKDAKILQGGDGILTGHSKGVPEAILPPRNGKSLDEISIRTEKALSKYIESGSLEIKKQKQGIILVLPEKLLFESARAEIRGEGIEVIDTLASILSGIKQNITIDGHTDSTPIKTFQYESNWHLSVARALNVAYQLLDQGVPEENLSIRGYGSQKPVAENLTEAGKAKNRRVEISITELKNDSPITENEKSEEYRSKE